MTNDKNNDLNKDLQKAAEQWIHLLMMDLRSKKIKEGLARKKLAINIKK